MLMHDHLLPNAAMAVSAQQVAVSGECSFLTYSPAVRRAYQNPTPFEVDCPMASVSTTAACPVRSNRSEDVEAPASNIFVCTGLG